MSQTTSYPLRSAPPETVGRRPTARLIAFTIAILACLPYLALKIAWISGSEIGIPAGSALLDPDQAAMMKAVNGLTVLMDSAVIGLALVLTRPWGRGVPAWLLAGPTWIATGLLGPIVVGFPSQALGSLLAGSDNGGLSSDSFLEPWVFTVVYTGFILQAFALGTLFVMYAIRRWGHLAAGRIDDLVPTPILPALRFTSVVAAVLAIIPLTMQVLWSTGSASGLNDGMAEDRGRDQLLAQAAHLPFTVAAVLGALMLALGLGGRLPLWVPLALAWAGSASLAASGGWMLLTSLGVTAVYDQPTPAMSAVYAVQVVTGTMIALAGTYFLAERSTRNSLLDINLGSGLRMES